MRYPEWFIGGPMDGEDKTETFPHIPEWSAIQAPQFMKLIQSGDDVSWSDPMYAWMYRRQTFTLGAVLVPFWTDDRLISREEIASRLGELIMAPHVKEEIQEGDTL